MQTNFNKAHKIHSINFQYLVFNRKNKAMFYFYQISIKWKVSKLQSLNANIQMMLQIQFRMEICPATIWSIMDQYY